MTFYLTSGLLLGLAAGFSPGPLLALVVSETLRQGRAAGIRVAMAPLLTDLPILILVLFGLGALGEESPLLGGLSLLGGVLVFFLGLAGISSRGAVLPGPRAEAHPLRKGILVNAVSPHPYLFWMSVGGPLVIRAWGDGPGNAPLFVGGFYLLLVGSKVFLAFLTARLRNFLSGRAYRLILRLLGLLLCLFGLRLVYEGLLFFSR